MKTTLILATLVLASLSGVCKAQNVDLPAEVYNTVSHDLGLDTVDINIKVREAFFLKNMPAKDQPAAATQKVGKKTYVIDIYYNLDTARLRMALIHELVHVSQMQAGRMIVGNKYIMFDGEKIMKEMPYQVRPFEVEAMTIADELFNKYFL
ncbi:MAG: hypothetical protein PHT07_24040 [Paludibacter sp.]|nr:hypothetical protein [Paludibacter sp.]